MVKESQLVCRAEGDQGRGDAGSGAASLKSLLGSSGHAVTGKECVHTCKLESLY